MSKSLFSAMALAVSLAAPVFAAGGVSEYAGSWQCRMEMTSRNIPFTLKLEEHDGKLSGSVTVPTGRAAVLAPVLLEDGSLYLTVDFIGWAEADFEYRLQGDVLTGTWDTGTDSGKLSGKRSSQEK